MSSTLQPRALGISNALSHYYDELCQVLAHVGGAPPGEQPPESFVPAFSLPPLTDALRAYFSPSHVRYGRAAGYRGHDLLVLDLMRNPRTHTAKTFPSLVMVARAVDHIRRTGEPVMLVTPSSANKGTALRDAVLRAIETGLVGPDDLRITTVVPAAARPKLWSSPLSADPDLRARNPVVVYTGSERSGVKTLAREFVDTYAGKLRELGELNLWYTLDLRNYRTADALRHFFERDCFPPREGVTRTHAHAVSSAYGLLGHATGVRHAAAGLPAARYLLVQHLETPDMVLNLHFGSTDRANMPAYAYDERAGIWRQDADPRFPRTTYDPAEVLEPTFYTHNPPTSPEMNDLIAGQGGSGIVVSLHECLERYGETRALLAGVGIELPADPRRLREWSLVMAVTGTLNAIDRGLVDSDEVVVHASGCYGDDDYEPIPGHLLHEARDTAGLTQVAGPAALLRATPPRPRATRPLAASVG